MTQLVDSFGRVHRDLRVSVTDRCSLRCTYCMPADFADWIPGEHILTADELARVVRIGVGLGITEVRLTGGEPLLRADLAQVVHELAQLEPRPDLALTTNGLRLAKLLPQLQAAGLNRVNVSLDTLRPEAFAQLTLRSGLPEVMAGIEAAVAAGLLVKMNAVLMRGVNEADAVPLLHWALDRGVQLRFIEQMPLDAGGIWRRDQMITADEIRELLGSEFKLTELPRVGSAPAQDYLVDGGPATVGIIASVTAPFCGNCDRLRLTADGQLRSCLFATEESDLRSLLRSDASDADIAEVFLAVVRSKGPGHAINKPGFVQPQRPMSAIGG